MNVTVRPEPVEGQALHHGSTSSPRTQGTTPSVLLPYQQKWVADQSPVKIFVKSRRIGGSWAEAGESALEASRKNGQDTWYIGYTKDMAIEFIRDVADWASYYNLVAGEIEEH